MINLFFTRKFSKNNSILRPQTIFPQLIYENLRVKTNSDHLSLHNDEVKSITNKSNKNNIPYSPKCWCPFNFVTGWTKIKGDNIFWKSLWKISFQKNKTQKFIFGKSVPKWKGAICVKCTKIKGIQFLFKKRNLLFSMSASLSENYFITKFSSNATPSNCLWIKSKYSTESSDDFYY